MESKVFKKFGEPIKPKVSQSRFDLSLGRVIDVIILFFVSGW